MLRALLVALLVLVGVAALAPFVAWEWLTSARGGAWLRQTVERTAADNLEGRVTVGGASLAGLLRLELTDVRLYAPGDDAPVLAVDRVVVDVRAAALAARRLELSELSLSHPVLRVVPEGGTTNLARALSPRQPAAPGPAKGTPDFTVHAPNILVEDGVGSMAGDSPVAVDGVRLALAVSGRLDHLTVSAKAAAHATAPVERAASLALEAEYLGGRVTVRSFALESGGSRLGLHGEAATNLSAAKVELVEGLLAAADVNALVPSAQLLGDVRLSGQAALERTSAKVQLLATLPSGEVELVADARLAPPDAAGFLLGYTAQLHVRDVEPAKVVAGMPEARVVAEVRVKGAGMPSQGTAQVVVDASGSRYEKLTLGQAQVVATTKGLVAQIESLRLVAAGATLTASGPADAKGAQLAVDLEVPDLARTREALEAGLALELPAMAGSVHASGHTAGTWAAPQGTLSFEVPALAFDGNVVQELAATVSVERAWPPLGSLTGGRIDAFSAAGLAGRRLRLGARIDGQTLRVNLDGELAGPPKKDTDGPPPPPEYLPVTLALEARRQPPPEKGVELWRLERFTARALGLEVASEQPATLELGHGATRINGLLLGGEVGRVALSGGTDARGAFEASLTIDRFQLDKLPETLLPRALGLGGTLAGSAWARGTADHPTAHAKVAVTNARYGPLDAMTGELEAGLESQVATASGTVRLPGGGRAGFTARLPTASPTAPVPAGAAAPAIDATVFLDAVDVALAAKVVPDLPQLGGKLTGTMQLAGTWRAPELHGTVALEDGQGFGVDALDATLELGWKDAKATWELEVKRAATLEAHLVATFPLEPAAVLAGKVPDPKTLPFDATFNLAQVDLGWLAHAGFAPADLAGKLAGRLHASGSLAAPLADGAFAASGVRTGAYRDLGLVLDVKAADRIDVRVGATLAQHDLATMTLGLQVAPATAVTLGADAWLDVPLAFEARLLPTPANRLVPSGAPQMGEEKPPFEAEVAGFFKVTGTAAAPEAHFHAGVDEVLVSGQRMGTFTCDADAVGPKTTFGGEFLSRDAGTLHFGGTLAGALGARTLSALGTARLKAQDPAATPTLGQALAASVADVLARRVDATADATNFDLALVNGLVPGVREIAGRLDLKVDKHGALGSPDVSGKLVVAGARAAVVEFGTFEQMRMDVDLAWPRVTLNDFSGKSGSGSFALRAATDALPGGGYGGEAHATLDALPLVQNYQTRGYLTMHADATDITWKDAALNVPKLAFTQGLLKIPRTQKSVQSLDPHPDVVFAGAAKKQAEPSKLGWKATVGIAIPDDFKVEAPMDNTVVLGASLTARLDDALDRDGKGAFDLSGKVRVPRGTISILQARFDVQPGSVVTLFPRQWDNPTLDITAVSDAKNVVVTATFTGTVQNLVRNFTSKPEMDESEILYFVATGQRQRKAQSDPFTLGKETLDDTLVGLVGSIGSSVAKDFLQKYIGGAADLDVLSLDTRGNAKVGTHLWNGRLYLGAEVHPNANVLANENTAELKAEYRINDHTYGRLRVGDQNHSGLEILYQDSVEAASQRKSEPAPP